MNYKIDIDVIYGIKPRKYQDGGYIVGNNNTPTYSGEGWHSNQLIPNFRAPYLQYFVNPNNLENTYVLLGAARDANLPFVADTASPEAGAYFDYSPDTLVGGEQMNPNTTYLAVDPYGRVINTSAASIVLNGKDMIPIDDSWRYDPYKGSWQQIPQSNQGQIQDADEVARRNSLYNLNEEFGLALGAQVPLNANPELLEGSMSITKPIVQGAAAYLLGGGSGRIAQAISSSAKGVPLWLGRTATTGLLSAEAAPAYADWAKADEVNKIGNYLNSINNFTGKDFETLVSAYGKDKAVAMLLGWIEAQKYAVSSSTGKVNQNSVFTVNNVQEPEWFSATNPNATFYLKDPNNLILGGMLGTAMFPTGKNAKFSASKAKWALLGLEALAYAYLTYDKHQKNFGTSQNVKKAQQIVETLNSLGYNFYGDLGNKQQSYSVQTNSQGQPQIDSTATPATPSGVMDSVPSVISEDISAPEEQPRPSWLHNLEAATVDSTSNQ